GRRQGRTAARPSGPVGGPMRITKVETMIVDVPFEGGGTAEGIAPTVWNELEMMLVRLEDDRGNVGWGEGFGYFVTDATKAVVDRTIAPLLLGAEVDDVPAWNRATQRRLHLFGRYGVTTFAISGGDVAPAAPKAVVARTPAPPLLGAEVDDGPAWNRATQRRLHLFGRYGVTTFAISGVDIALWDLKAKREQAPLHELLAPGAAADPVGCYASPVRYDDTAIAPRVCEEALADGFTDLKLHEIALPDIEACRRAVGDGVPLAIDVNCNWSVESSREAIPRLVA